MIDRNDGGSAFLAELDKHYDFTGKPYGTEGMSLRDWFAGQILIGLCHDAPLTDSIRVAKTAFIFADAMIKVRKEKS